MSRERSCTSGARGHEHRPHRHAHEDGCCGNHGHAHSDRASWWGSILPILACAVCPTCLGVWAQVFSAVGVGVAITETQHHLLLGAAIVVTLGVSVVRFVRTQLRGPFALTIIGCAFLTVSHLLAEESHLLSWLSIAVILGASLWQRRLERHGTSHVLVQGRESTFSADADEAA